MGAKKITRVKDLNKTIKKELINSIESSGNNKTFAAEMLGINRWTLIYRLKQYGLWDKYKKQ